MTIQQKKKKGWARKDWRKEVTKTASRTKTVKTQAKKRGSASYKRQAHTELMKELGL